MCAVVYREMRLLERLISDVTDDVMRDVTTSVISTDSRQLAVDFHMTYVTQQLEVLRRCCRVVEMSRVRAYLSRWKTRLSSK